MRARSHVLIRAVAVAGLVLLGVWIWTSRQRTETTRIGGSVVDGAPGKLVDDPAGVASPDMSASRTPQAERAPDGASAAAADKTTSVPRPRVSFRVRARVLDVRGSPVAGVRVGDRKSERAAATSDALGSFEIELTENPVELAAVDEAWVTVRYAHVRKADVDGDHFLIVAPSLALAGKVADTGGRALVGALIKVDVPISAFAGFPLALDATGLESFATKSGSDGGFELRRAPALPKGRLMTSYPKLQSDVRSLPSESAADLYIELKELSEDGAFLEGSVVHEDDKPASGARVLLADREAIADKSGRFRMALAPVGPLAPLAAILPGFQPAIVPEYGRVLESTGGHPPPVRLVLGPPPLSISGRVLDADGKPARKWTVTLLEGTALSQNRIPIVTAERVTAKGDVQVITASDGSFRLGGLRDISYRLQAWNGEGLIILSPSLRAGSKDVELRAPADSFIEKISGHVRSQDGLPISDAHVTLRIVTERASYGSAFFDVKSTRTKADGSFVLEHVPKHFGQLGASGESIQDTHCELDDVDLSRAIEIVVRRMCRFRFECDAAEGAADAISVLDADGTMLGLVTKDAGGMSSTNMAELSEGRSHVLSVSESATRLVLYRNGEAIWSRPLHLSPNEISLVRRDQER
jgi:hypothetical protein